MDASQSDPLNDPSALLVNAPSPIGCPAVEHTGRHAWSQFRNGIFCFYCVTPLPEELRRGWPRPIPPIPAPGPAKLVGGGGAAPQAPASAAAGAEPPAGPPRDAWLRLRWAAALALEEPCPLRKGDQRRLLEAVESSGKAGLPAEREWPEGEDFRLACRQAVLARMPSVGGGPYPGLHVLDALDRACAILARLEAGRG